MFESGAALTTGRHAGGAVSRARLEVTIILLSLVLLIAGTVASLGIENRWSDVISNHLGGLGLVGLLASQTAHLARKRGRDWRAAFLAGSLLPIGLGGAAVVLVYLRTGFVYCGGGVVLLSAILVALVACCLKKRVVGPA